MAEMVEISKVDDGTRLLRWFLRRFPAMPQREFYKLCRGGQIRVNSSRARGQEILRTGDVVRIPPTVAGYARAAVLFMMMQILSCLISRLVWPSRGVRVSESP